MLQGFYDEVLQLITPLQDAAEQTSQNSKRNNKVKQQNTESDNNEEQEILIICIILYSMLANNPHTDIPLYYFNIFAIKWIVHKIKKQ